MRGVPPQKTNGWNPRKTRGNPTILCSNLTTLCGMESLAEDGLKLSFAKPLAKQGLFKGRVLKDTTKRHVGPGGYRSWIWDHDHI